MKWILDFGHGGLDPKTGEYTTGAKKRYKFPDGYEILEGVINRKVGEKLIKKLDKACYNYSVASHDYLDIPLRARSTFEKKEHATCKGNTVFLSIHANSASTELQGEGTEAKGSEVWTSKGLTPSDEIATVFYLYLQKGGCKMRKDESDGDVDKEADFHVLKFTKGRAVLVELDFFDNRERAEYMDSEEGQEFYAQCLFGAIKHIEKNLEMYNLK